MSLEAYKSKRDFSRTSEPDASSSKEETQHRFVVQEHHASHLHYDFRLEMDGVLKSWAVPKGPPPASGVRRLAVMTEDHPLEYLTFAGTIPDGNYGAGEMSIWDSGTFESLADADPDAGVKRGKLELLLHGKKLQGKYDFIRTDDAKNNWIFIKSKYQPQVVVASLVGSKDAAVDVDPGAAALLAALKGSRKAEMFKPEDVDPMLASTREAPFDDPDWQFEIKWDGYRALAFIQDGASQMYSRNHQPLMNRVAELTDLTRWFSADQAIVDGEIVALDRQGRPNFQELQDRFGFRLRRERSNSTKEEKKSFSKSQLFYMVFDILYCNGSDVAQAPLWQRRQLLQKLIIPGGPVRFSDHVDQFGTQLFGQISAMGLEGIMAKKRDSPYKQQRSDSWLKIRLVKTTDVVVVGYTESAAQGRPFASLLIGQYDGDQLVPVGHVGTGFDNKSMRNLIEIMHPLQTETPLFAANLTPNGKPHWLRPELAAEVKYVEMTSDGQLRQPVFLHLRPDKDPKACQIAFQKDFKDGAGGNGGKREVQRSLLQSVHEPLSKLSKDEDAELDVDGGCVRTTHLSKVFWPKSGTTKRDLLAYYEAISPYMLPHLSDRPVIVERYPNGVEGFSFFQHDIGGAKGARHTSRPDFLSIYSVDESSGTVDYAVCNNAASLLYLVNLGAIPIHTWNIKTDNPQFPDRIIFDFDPPESLAQAVDAAHLLKSVLDDIGLTAYPKTSGANGIHVAVPIFPVYDSDTTMAVAKLIGQTALERSQSLITLERRIKNRGASRVYLDCVQNRVGKTIVAPYSVRACDLPTVSAPLTWEELTKDIDMEAFVISAMPERLSKMQDLFMPVLNSPQFLQSAIRKLLDLNGAEKDQGAAILASITQAESATSTGKTKQ